MDLKSGYYQHPACAIATRHLGVAHTAPCHRKSKQRLLQFAHSYRVYQILRSHSLVRLHSRSIPPSLALYHVFPGWRLLGPALTCHPDVRTRHLLRSQETEKTHRRSRRPCTQSVSRSVDISCGLLCTDRTIRRRSICNGHNRILAVRHESSQHGTTRREREKHFYKPECTRTSWQQHLGEPENISRIPGCDGATGSLNVSHTSSRGGKRNPKQRHATSLSSRRYCIS